MSPPKKEVQKSSGRRPPSQEKSGPRQKQQEEEEKRLQEEKIKKEEEERLKAEELAKKVIKFEDMEKGKAEEIEKRNWGNYWIVKNISGQNRNEGEVQLNIKDTVGNFQETIQFLKEQREQRKQRKTEIMEERKLRKKQQLQTKTLGFAQLQERQEFRSTVSPQTVFSIPEAGNDGGGQDLGEKQKLIMPSRVFDFTKTWKPVDYNLDYFQKTENQYKEQLEKSSKIIKKLNKTTKK